MKLPPDGSGEELIEARHAFGYSPMRQKHHEVVPDHNPIQTGTLSGILKRIAAHHRLTFAKLGL